MRVWYGFPLLLSKHKNGSKDEKKNLEMLTKFIVNELPTYVKCETILLIPRPPKFCKYIIY